MIEFLRWDTQADANTSLAAVEAIYDLPYSEGDYVMDDWDNVTQSDTTSEWGFYKPQVMLGKLQVDLMAACEAGYTETANIPDDWIVEGSETILLSEPFDTNGDISIYTDWSVVDDGTVGAPSIWTVTGNVLQQTTNIRDGLGNALPQLGTYASYDPGISWTDYSLELDLDTNDDDTIGVMFRVSDSSNYYRFSLSSQQAFRRIVKNVAGVFTLLAEDTVAYTVGQTYALEIVVQGSSITVSIDGTEILSATDTSLSSGTIGLYSFAHGGSYFDNVVVTEL